MGERPLRADAARNRRRIVAGARKVFAERGADASVEDIAKAAGVGMGTLYRHFPAKEDLLEAVFAERVETLVERFEAAATERDPWTAFARAAHGFAELQVSHRGFLDATQDQLVTEPRYLPHRERLFRALEPILLRAQEAGVLRRDVVVDDIPSLLSVASRLPRARIEAEPGLWERYLAIILDGLRPEAAHPLPHPPPKRRVPGRRRGRGRAR